VERRGPASFIHEQLHCDELGIIRLINRPAHDGIAFRQTLREKVRLIAPSSAVVPRCLILLTGCLQRHQ
jgi:hypothetical protein